jgi:hypothetical protein
MNNFLEGLLITAINLTIFQLMYFFYFDEGRVQKWRLRKSIDSIINYCSSITKAGDIRAQVHFVYKGKVFDVGIFDKDVNYHYKLFDIYVNGEHDAEYHCLKHDCLRSYKLCTHNNRSSTEVIKLIHAAAKKVKKLEKELTEKKDTTSLYSNSYFK